MPFKRPRLTKREESAAPAPASSKASAPKPAKASGKGISTRELQAALGGSYTTPPAASSGGSKGTGSGISTQALGQALTKSGSTSGSVQSSRVTSYPMDQDLNALPVKAGTRSGPRVTSYRISLRKAAHSNVYDTIT
jgi:hypothetical protein